MTSARHYLSFVSVLFKLIVPLKLLRFIVLLCMAAWPLGLILQWQFGWQWVQVPIVAGGFVVLLSAIFILPSQVITLASSRPVSLLSNLRQLLFCCLVICSLLLGLSIYWAFSFSPWGASFPSLLLVTWLIVSFGLQLSVWLCSRWNGAQGFIFLLNMLIDDLARWLSDFNPMVLAALLVASWFLFSQWWLRWCPVKYQPNLYLDGLGMQKFQFERQGSSPWFTGRANSWIGSRLLGLPDSWQSNGKRILVTIFFFLLMASPSYLIISFEQLQVVVLEGSRFFVILVGAFALGAATSFYKNLRSVWLFTIGKRDQLFLLLWNCYWRATLPWTAILFGIALAVELTLGEWRSWTHWSLLLMTILLFKAFLFHLMWLIYQKTNASLVWCNWVGLIVILIWVFTIFAAGLIFPLPFDLEEISVMWVILPETLALLLIHKRVRSGFSNTNFLRVV